MKHVSAKFFLIFPLLLLLLVLTARFSASGSYSGGWFNQETQGYVGMYLEDSGILTSDEEAVHVSGSTATIVKAGHYELSGSLSDGQIIVDAGPEDEVVLELDNVNIHCEHSCPIWVKQADRVKLKLPEDSLNILSDGAFYDAPAAGTSSPKACVYSRSDLTIKGKGSLTVNAAFHSGIVSTDSLYIKNGILTVNAPHYALRGNDDVTIVGGVLTLESGDDGICSSGYIDVQGGELSLTAGACGLRAVTGVNVGQDSRLRCLSRLESVQCLKNVSLAYDITEGA